MNSKYHGILLILLVITLPFASAVQISDVQATEITDRTAEIIWKTDEEANSFVNYGKSADQLSKTGDAAEVTQHKFKLDGLEAETTYHYGVESEGVVDNNNGNYYTFTTKEPDTTPPELHVEIPSLIPGNQLDVSGETEEGATVTIFVNDVAHGTTVAEVNGSFSFAAVFIPANEDVDIRIEASDQAGNMASSSGTSRADTQRPSITLKNVKDFTDKNTVKLKGNISEESSFEVFVNNRSISKGQGKSIDVTARLEEGMNKIRVTAVDSVGLTGSTEINVESDTQPPRVDFYIERGNEYYEGSAGSNIFGGTEPGSKVFLYIYKPLGQEFKPNFKNPREVVTADENGNFTFENVKFAVTVRDTFANLTPKLVPSGLERVSIFPIREVTEQQQFTYYVYVIAEDKSGKTGYDEERVTVHTCLSDNLDFDVGIPPEFVGPGRLDPQLIEQGRQDIQAVFTFDYSGSGLPRTSVGGEEIEPGYRIQDVRIEPACTQGMLKDPKSGLACRVFPRSNRPTPNNDKSAVHVQWRLHKADEFLQKNPNIWQDLEKRLLVFPVKVSVRYQERTGQGDEEWSDMKFQTSCRDLAYAVDVPINSSTLAAVFLADEQIALVNGTLTAIKKIRPTLEKIYVYTGYVCMGSWLARTFARFTRVFSSKLEAYYSVVKPKKQAKTTDGSEPRCPVNQDGLYMKETIEDWYDMLSNGYNGDPRIPKKVQAAYNADGGTYGENSKGISMDHNCPKTASMWSFEKWMDTALKWSCDRTLCRAVPAGWTSDKNVEDIGTVILSQQQCAVTGRGVPLLRRENCQKILQVSIHRREAISDAVSREEEVKVNTCWEDANGILYYDPGADGTDLQLREDTGLYKLTPIGRRDGQPLLKKTKLKVYKPKGADNFVVGKDVSCATVCKDRRKDGYSHDVKGSGNSQGCYTEKNIGGKVKLIGAGGSEIGNSDAQKKVFGKRYSAGYTSDCFVDESSNTNQPTFSQCVCVGEEDELPEYETKDDSNTLRTAVKEVDGVDEKWSYRQSRIFKESQKTVGTYYPKERYYTGRDVSGAFGADHLLDYFKGENDKNIHEVNPHSQFIGAVQSVCLASWIKNLVLLESFLQGYQTCLIEAKNGGIQDAGMCKTWLTQNVCGLAYKAIAYFQNDCSPLNFDDVGKEGQFEDIEVIFKGGIESMGEALDSSIDDIKEDYGNAQLNSFFKAGTQGFVTSMCLAAFGVEFPLFTDEFQLDLAYSFPTKTTVLLSPAERELMTYNPAKNTAVHNYNLASLIVPGCRIKRWQMSLKCIGPEDLQYEGAGVDPTCGGKQCDCTNIEGTGSASERLREYPLKSGFNLPSGKVFNVPLESPQQVDSQYRYDHVIMRLDLDPSEKGNEDKCFDEGYRQGNRGIWYVPITDVGQPLQLDCHADATTGKYQCPQLRNLFGFGGANIEKATCRSKDGDGWVDCETPNLFIKDDEIKIRAHLDLDDKGKCLKRTISGKFAGFTQHDRSWTLAENAAGPLRVEDSLGFVKGVMFGSVADIIQKVDSKSNDRCEELSYNDFPDKVTGRGDFEFRFIPSGGGVGELKIPSRVFVIPGQGYDGSGGETLRKGSQRTFTVKNINQVKFNINGFIVSNVLGKVKPDDSNPVCTYTIQRRGQTAQQNNVRFIDVTYQLYELDEGGSCTFAKQPVKPSQGKARLTQRVRIQRQLMEDEAAGGMHEDFMKGNYQKVISTARDVVKRKSGTVEDAVAVYYSVAAFIKGGDRTHNAADVKGYLDLFFDRNSVYGQSDPYPATVTSAGEYQKIHKYLCLVDSEYGSKHASDPTKCS